MNKINVFSEIGNLKRVLVHTPGKEIERVNPGRLDEFLFSAVLEPDQAREEHLTFIKLMEQEGVEVVQLVDLFSETFDSVSQARQEQLIEQFLDEASPKLSASHRSLVRSHLLKLDTKTMTKTMMAGLYGDELNLDNHQLILEPMPNLYFMRDTFAAIGNGVSINRMKYATRNRESLFTDFIFSDNANYKNTKKYYKRNDVHNIEGGDIFIYTPETLVIGISERTSLEAIKSIAAALQKEQKDNAIKFQTIIAINVPKARNLMHLDTWITMVDHNKFLYSPNVVADLSFYKIDLSQKEIKIETLKQTLEEVLASIIKEKAILIPVAGENARQIDIDIETHFDATNYLVLKPGLVIGYDRNRKTAAALEKAGVRVINLPGNQLSLGMGSCRCMSMPLVRTNLEA